MLASPEFAAASRRPPKRLMAIAGWSVLGLLAAVFGVYLLTVTLGAVHGVEFCPQTFERRSYSFYELPVIGIQVTGVRREDLPTAAETFLATAKLLPTPAGKQRDWHIVVGSRGLRLARKGDANILLQYLEAREANQEHRWVKWSEDHPELAKIFWPAVQRLAIEELYVFVPDLFDLTKLASDPAEFRKQVDRQLAARLAFVARRWLERGNQEAAKRLVGEVESLDPQNGELAGLREALGGS